jgi:hypothetical protein
MQQNIDLRLAVASHLRAHISASIVPPEDIHDTWKILDGEEDTPAILVYLDEGERSDEYVDQPEQYDGNMFISIYVSGTSNDSDLDDIGEAVKQAIHDQLRIAGIGTFRRTSFNYERSVEAADRALHLNHAYKWE